MIGFEEMYSWVRDLPIIDWHNHLDLAAIDANRPLGSLYEVWVKADPYKHRAMRICGESEDLITGTRAEAEKWSAWMRTLPKLVGNPIFAWARLELDFLGKVLGVKLDGWENGELPNLSLSALTPKRILSEFKVEYFDPGYRLSAGEKPDFAAMELVHRRGGRIVDVSVDEMSAIKFADMVAIGRFAVANGWTMLLHLGALRKTSERLRALAGPAGGYAAMRAPVNPVAVAELLDGLERDEALPRTILLSLNPEAHAQLSVLSGSFNGAGMPGKVQLGPAWWWCDHEEGICDVLEKNAAYGVLSTFVGMTTDSRSLLSLVRHDYFRRVLCKWILTKVSARAFPGEEALLRPILENICYCNAKEMVS